MDKIFKIIQDVNAELVEMRKELHKIPEIGGDLPKTRKYVQNKLDSYGISYELNQGDSGLVAYINGDGDGKTLAFRADMDALNVQEENDLPYKSIHDGKMHGCGHDAHTAILLATAKVLSKNKNLINGRVKLVFQAGEETGTGAKQMIKEGVLHGVDAFCAVHVGNLAGDDNKSGNLIVKSGAVTAGKDKFTITVKGKGTHSAFPEKGVDPMLISARIVNGAEELIAREIPAGTPAVLSFGSIVAGKDHNTIPETAEIKGSIRCQDEDVRTFLGERLKEMACGIAKAFRGEAIVNINKGSKTVMNDPTLANYFYETLKSVYKDEVLCETKSELMGSDDFANYAQQLPSVLFFLHTNNVKKGICAPNHNPKFDVDEEVLIKAVTSYVLIAINYLKK